MASILFKFNQQIFSQCRNFLIQKRFFKLNPACLSNEPTINNPNDSSNQLTKLSSEEVNKRLMQFFDLPDNWNKEEVKSGRSWRMDELRIKSNSDLHKLWYILYKERNMLLTMQQAAKEQVDNMPSPERIDKVEDSMKNIEEVIKERNRAYYQLEVGDPNMAERRRAFRKDLFGRWRWIACSEHIIPYWLNVKWRKMNGPGFGNDIVEFKRKLNERKLDRQMSKNLKDMIYCRELIRRFPNMDLEYLQEKFPHVDIQNLKSNLNNYILKHRSKRFHNIFYEKKNEL